MKAEPNIGHLIFKRTVIHKKADNKTWVGDVYKTGYCIKCPMVEYSQELFDDHVSCLENKKQGTDVNDDVRTPNEQLKANGVMSADGKNLTIFGHKHANKANTELARKKFKTECLGHAFHSDHSLKAEYTCPRELQTSQFSPEKSAEWYGKDQVLPAMQAFRYTLSMA